MLEKGDFLERNWKDTIRKIVPAYEDVWGNFIGHNGYGKMIEVFNLSENEQRSRIRFSECNYTCLESIICMNHISENLFDINSKTSYLNSLNNLLSFHGNAGRIRDNLIEMMEIYLNEGKRIELIKELEGVYQRRNTALHGKKIPFRVEETIMLIAKIKGAKENRNEWHDTMTWEEYKGELIFLDDYYKKSVEEIAFLYNKILYNLKEPIFNLIKEKNIKIEFPKVEVQHGVSGFNPSGSCSTIGYYSSGVIDY